MCENVKTEFETQTIAELSELIKRKEVSPVEIVQVTLDRIKETDGQLNSFITVMEEQALQAASIAEIQMMNGEIRSPLHGIPIGIKDMIHTKDCRTTMGSSLYENFQPTKDATVVSLLKNAGAIVVGKLNTHEFAYGTTGDNSHIGPVQNPYNPLKITGGSSSGSGAAVAMGLCYGAIGTDTGGSIRIPSSFCHVTGMKPTFGLVSNQGIFPLSPSLDHAGVMTRTVKDNALMLNVLAEFDGQDRFSIERKKEDYTSRLNEEISGTIIGVPTNFFFDGIDTEIQEALDRALAVYRSLGSEIIPVTLIDMDRYKRAHSVILQSEAFTIHKEHLEKFGDTWKGEVPERLLSGAQFSAFDYIESQTLKRDAFIQFSKVLNEVDVLFAPVTSIMPTNIGERNITINDETVHIFSVLNKLSGPANLTGLPAISVPCGFSKSGLPIGFQLIGRAFDESNLYRFSYAYEQVRS